MGTKSTSLFQLVSGEKGRKTSISDLRSYNELHSLPKWVERTQRDKQVICLTATDRKSDLPSWCTPWINDFSYSETEYKKHLQLRWKECIGKHIHALSWGSGGLCSVLAPWDTPSLPWDAASHLWNWDDVSFPDTVQWRSHYPTPSWLTCCQNSLSLNKCEHAKAENHRAILNFDGHAYLET